MQMYAKLLAAIHETIVTGRNLPKCIKVSPGCMAELEKHYIRPIDPTIHVDVARFMGIRFVVNEELEGLDWEV